MNVRECGVENRHTRIQHNSLTFGRLLRQMRQKILDSASSCAGNSWLLWLPQKVKLFPQGGCTFCQGSRMSEPKTPRGRRWQATIRRVIRKRPSVVRDTRRGVIHMDIVWLHQDRRLQSIFQEIQHRCQPLSPFQAAPASLLSVVIFTFHWQSDVCSTSWTQLQLVDRPLLFVMIYCPPSFPVPFPD